MRPGANNVRAPFELHCEISLDYVVQHGKL